MLGKTVKVILNRAITGIIVFVSGDRFSQLCISGIVTSLQDKRKVKNMERKHTSVYLNCCSTFFTVCEQSRHLKVASRSSGRTSLVRVTTPITDVNFPISAVVSSLNLTTQVIANLS